jgi:hypothetical protein
MSSDDEDLDSVSEEEEAPQKARKQRKKKAKKDPNKPKRNMSAFFLYSNTNRDRVKEENPDAKFGDIVSFGRRCSLCRVSISRAVVVYAPFDFLWGVPALAARCLSAARLPLARSLAPLAGVPPHRRGRSRVAHARLQGPPEMRKGCASHAQLMCLLPL